MANVDKSKPGWEHYIDYSENFHDRLATHWPEPREQLHAGGWRVTERLAKILSLDKRTGQQILDLCCGEGATACYYAKEYPDLRITGIDIVEKAIEKAKVLAQNEKLEERVKFVAANAFHLPFETNTFDCVYGQDPDALSHEERVLIFKELLRVLKPGGDFIFMHHWIPGPGFPAEDAKAIDKFNKELQFLAMDNCNGDKYLEDLKTAGFEIVFSDDLTDLASSHMRGIALIYMRSKGEISDKWLLNNLSYIDRGLPFGIQAICRKPSPKDTPAQRPDPTRWVMFTAVMVAFIALYYVRQGT